MLFHLSCQQEQRANEGKAQQVNLNTSPANYALQKAIDAFAKDPVLKYGDASVCVSNVTNGQVLASYQSNKALIPASSLKIVPTATALALLGKDYRFETELQYSGQIREGVLEGNIYIKGVGDPTLGSDQMEETIPLETLMDNFVAAIKGAGIREIKGQIVGDASYLPSAVNSKTWQWNDLGNYYASGAWGLNIHENLYYLRFQQTSKLGATPKIKIIEPSIPAISFTNELASAGKGTGDNAYIYGVPYSEERFVRGTIPIGSQLFSIKGAMPDPPQFAASYLEKKLQESGMNISYAPTTNLKYKIQPINRTTIYRHQSPTLFEIAQRTNFKSVNLYAEALLRAVGKKQTSDGSLKASIKASKQFWKNKGMNTKGWFLEDGCGLSPRNGISSKHFVDMLHLIHQDKNLFDSFYKTLAVGGKSGTLRNMFKGTAAQGKIHAKSGSISRVRSYTGYAQTKTGELVAFSIIANNYTCKNSSMRKKMEALMIAMCK